MKAHFCLSGWDTVAVGMRPELDRTAHLQKPLPSLIFSILFFKLWLDKRETGLQRPIQKAQTANSSQACAGSVVSHLSTLLGINVSSPASDPALHLALPSHIHDFINSQHHMQSAQVSQEAAGWVLTPPRHRKPKEHSSWSNGFLIKQKATVLQE